MDNKKDMLRKKCKKCKEGKWITLTGDPKSGKTTTSMQIAKNCQELDRTIIYLDVEGRLKKSNFELAGLDITREGKDNVTR